MWYIAIAIVGLLAVAGIIIASIALNGNGNSGSTKNISNAGPAGAAGPPGSPGLPGSPGSPGFAASLAASLATMDVTCKSLKTTTGDIASGGNVSAMGTVICSGGTLGSGTAGGLIINSNKSQPVTFNEDVLVYGDIHAGKWTSPTAPTAGGGNIIADSGITATAGDITADAGNITATEGNITATKGNITATAGSVTALTSVTIGSKAVVVSNTPYTQLGQTYKDGNLTSLSMNG